jgi:hypothetical protein
MFSGIPFIARTLSQYRTIEKAQSLLSVEQINASLQEPWHLLVYPMIPSVRVHLGNAFSFSPMARNILIIVFLYIMLYKIIESLLCACRKL